MSEQDSIVTLSPFPTALTRLSDTALSIPCLSERLPIWPTLNRHAGSDTDKLSRYKIKWACNDVQSFP